MINWIHHLLEPHCPFCADEREMRRVCQSCETLKHQLEVANYEKKILLNQIIELNKPQIPIPPTQTMLNLDEIRPKTVPWNVRRQMLEEEDRKKAQVLRAVADEAKKATEVKRGPSGGVEVNIDDSITQLEKELGIKGETA